MSNDYPQAQDENTDADKVILDEATERFERIQSDDKDNRDNYRADTLFVYSPGNQWPDEVRAVRTQWKELCLEFNQLKQFVAQVVNDQRQNRPGVRFHPASGDASKDVAEIMQGLTRSIENDSNAEAVYDNAFQSAVVGGRGAWRVCSEYADTNGFNQKLCIKPINDMLKVWADLNYQQPDGSDRNFIFIEEDCPKDEFERQWPNAKPISWDSLDSCWGSSENIKVVDYYRRVCNKRVLVMMSDGAIGFKDEMPTPPEGITIVKERDVDDYKVEWFTIAGGQQILATYDWPGPIIPVIIIPGEDMILDGKRIYQGLTRHARDAQSMLNFGMTQQAIHLSLTPKAPWVIAEGQVEGYETIWRDANQKNYSYLPYKPVTIGESMAPPPQRTAPSMPDAGWDRWCQTMIAMIKSTIGMYEQSLGQKGNETSGRAITAREKQGDTATFNFVDNLSRGIAMTGRIFQYAFPVYYDTQQMVQVVNPDDTRKMVMINQSMPNPDNPAEAIKNNDITVGKYAVTCEAGPSYATKRQETSEALMSLVQAFPPAAQVAGDLIVKSLDVADADIIAERLKLIMPPQVMQAEQAKKEGKTPPDPQMMQQMQQQQQQLEQAKETMDAMHKQITDLQSGAQEKLQAAQVDAQVKMQLAQADAAAKLEQSQVDADAAIKKAHMDAVTKIELAKIDAETKITIAGMNTPPELSVTGQLVPSQQLPETPQNAQQNQEVAQ
jgi:hypothetical protein